MINLSKYKPSTKKLMAALTIAGLAWQQQSIRDPIISFIHSHPHYAGAAWLIGALWTLVHNPEVQKFLEDQQRVQ